MFHFGVCAFASGKANTDIAIVAVRIKAKVVAVFCFEFFIFFLSPRFDSTFQFEAPNLISFPIFYTQWKHKVTLTSAYVQIMDCYLFEFSV